MQKLSSLHCETSSGNEIFKDWFKFSIGLIAQLLLSSDCIKDMLMFALQVLKVEFFELTNFTGLDLVDETSDTSIQDADLFLSNHWHILLLLQEFSQFLSSVKKMLSGSIKIWTELGEGSDFSVLGQLKLEWTGDLLHGLDLGSWSDSWHRQTDVNGWSDTLIEKLSFQENLSIGNGDHIGWDIGRHITSLGFDNGEGSQWSTTVLHVHLSCSFQQTRVKIEDISWVGLSAWWSSKKEWHLSVSDGLLWQIVIDDETMFSVISEVFSNSASWIRSQELKWSGLWSSSSNDDGVSQSIVVFQGFDNVSDGWSLLTNGDVNAIELLGVCRIWIVEGRLLVNDGINGNSSLSSLSITNDQFSLTSSNWDLLMTNEIRKKDGLPMSRLISDLFA